MLFSTQIFILVFLPIAVLAYRGAATGPRARLVVLLASSFVFYGWWDPRFLPLLAGTIVVNWLLSNVYSRTRRGSVIVIGVALNLVVLAGFKYTNFLLEAALTLAGVEFRPYGIVLPLGISFFTFQQISYLVDLKRGEAGTYGLLEYSCFVSFFPQLIAGPIVRHNELIPQFAQPVMHDDGERAARGLVLFILGLGKKVFLADELAPIADAGFALAGGAAMPGTEMAWQAALAYSLQLYFDFSSYSDMAMGLAALYGFDLPLNFDNPYRAASIREFWRRWHMTLSRFLRDYVYVPMGGSRQGAWRTAGVVVLTMLLCGLWHGAGWTFVAWGGLHGLAVCCNRLWIRYALPMPSGGGWVLTTLFVVLGWVLFRAEDFGTAARMFAAMAGVGGSGAADDEAWPFVALGCVFAALGPTNVELSRQAWIARRAVAIPVALLCVATVLRVGQGRGLEFIYFQF